MRKLMANKKGQFIVIAVLMVAIMMISVGSIMYTAVTYYRHERWEEYLAIVDNVEITAYRLVEISLANYTVTLNPSILKTNLDKWQRDLLKTYPEFRVVLSYVLASGGTTINYDQGLNRSWNKRVSFSAAKATFAVNITSVGLTGYKFTTPILLNTTILDVLWYKKSKIVGVRLTVTREDLASVSLQRTNFALFQLNGGNITNFSSRRYYESQTYKCFVYELRYSTDTKPSTPVTVAITLFDNRGIKVMGRATFSSITEI